jgi:hypothetical protein
VLRSEAVNKVCAVHDEKRKWLRLVVILHQVVEAELIDAI